MARTWEYDGTRKDFRGLELCCKCWNGQHYGSANNNKQFAQCEGGACECPCREMLGEKTQRKVPAITEMLPMDDLLDIGPKS